MRRVPCSCRLPTVDLHATTTQSKRVALSNLAQSPRFATQRLGARALTWRRAPSTCVLRRRRRRRQVANNSGSLVALLYLSSIKRRLAPPRSLNSLHKLVALFVAKRQASHHLVISTALPTHQPAAESTRRSRACCCSGCGKATILGAAPGWLLPPAATATATTPADSVPQPGNGGVEWRKQHHSRSWLRTNNSLREERQQFACLASSLSARRQIPGHKKAARPPKASLTLLGGLHRSAASGFLRTTTRLAQRAR